MLFVTVLYLYAARLILAYLGVEDYGVYNVVGSVVTFMGFITSFWDDRIEAMFEPMAMKWVNFGVRYKLMLKK